MYTFIFLQNETNIISFKTPMSLIKKPIFFSPLLIFFPLLLLGITPRVLRVREDKYSLNRYGSLRVWSMYLSSCDASQPQAFLFLTENFN